ncbi:unnamed protein product [Auanema sp. JU1783]|nr:unnamed protein product [Auanema sp. JU1783]
MLSRPTRNVLQLGLGFLLFFISFNSQGYIQEAVIAGVADENGIDQHAGYNGLALYYGVFTAANLFIAPLIEVLGPKWAMTIGAILTTLYEIGFLHINEFYFFFTSALSGFGAALMWPALGTYMTLNSTEKTIDRNSSIVWALSQASQIIGGIVLLTIFHHSSSDDNTISPTAIKIISISLTIVLILSTFVFALLRHPPSETLKHNEVAVSYNNASFATTFALLPTKRMILLAFVFCYTGIVQSLWTSIYPTAISFTQQMGNNNSVLMALSAISSGFGQILLCSWVAARRFALKRNHFVITGFFLHIISFIGIYINFPPNSSIHLTNDIGIIQPNPYLTCFISFILGFGDGCWNTQVYALIGDVFSHCSNEAFALFNFYQSALTCASLFYSAHITLTSHLAILCTSSTIAVFCFCLVDAMGRLSQGKKLSLGMSKVYQQH